MADDAHLTQKTPGDEARHAAEMRRVTAVGLALTRAKHDLNNLFHVARGWSRLLKDPRSGVVQTQEGIDAVLNAAEQTGELVNGILALNGRTSEVVTLCNLAQELGALTRGLRYLLPAPGRLSVELATAALVLCNFSEVRGALLDCVLGLRDTLGDDEVWLRLRDLPGSDAASEPEVELLLERVAHGAPIGAPPKLCLCLLFAAEQAVVAGSAPTRSETRAHADPEASRFSLATGSPATVLLVDDHRDVRRLATTMLERAGYQVLTASDAEEALNTSQNYDGPIHVLCCDAQMPGLPSFQLIAALCAQRPTLKVLVCSGERPQGKLAEFPHLSKPFSYQQLVSAVRSSIE